MRMACRACRICGCYNDISQSSCRCGNKMTNSGAQLVDIDKLGDRYGNINPNLVFYYQRCSACGRLNFTLDINNPVKRCENCGKVRIASVKPIEYKSENQAKQSLVGIQNSQENQLNKSNQSYNRNQNQDQNRDQNRDRNQNQNSQIDRGSSQEDTINKTVQENIFGKTNQLNKPIHGQVGRYTQSQESKLLQNQNVKTWQVGIMDWANRQQQNQFDKNNQLNNKGQVVGDGIIGDSVVERYSRQKPLNTLSNTLDNKGDIGNTVNDSVNSWDDLLVQIGGIEDKKEDKNDISNIFNDEAVKIDLKERKLVIIPVGRLDRRTEINPGMEVMIGRGAFQSDILAKDLRVSNYHCKLYCKGRRWFVKDNNSSNGTFLNGKDIGLLGERALKNGDVIALGHTADSMKLEVILK